MVRTCLLTGVAALLPATALAANLIGNCEMTGTIGDMAGATPLKPCQLTVAVSLPAPNWWIGDTPGAIKEGYEYCLAAALAWHAGYDKVQVVDVDWAALNSGAARDFDLALSELAITDERKKTADFSIPYLDLGDGVLVKTGTAIDEKTIKDMRIGVLKGTPAADFAANTLKLKSLNPFPEQGAMLTALRAGQVDAVIAPASIVLAEEAMEKGALAVVGQYKTGEAYGALYPKGSTNAAAFDKIIGALKADGTMAKLAQKYLAPVWGKDPATVPYFAP